MNKIKIPKDWTLKYFEIDGDTIKFVYEDGFKKEHIYIDQKPEQELPTYEELQKRLDFMIEQNDKKQEALDKIKEKVKELDRFDPCGSMAVSMSISQFQEDLERLLEEIE